MRKERGFSLIEMLIVVAIILIIAAIAIPNLLRARMAANEASAVNSVRQIKTAEFTYYEAYQTIGFANALADLGGPASCTPAATSACILDSSVSAAVTGTVGKSGYVFAATGLNSGGTINSSFVAAAAPINAGQSGGRDFCTTNDTPIRFQASAAGNVPVTSYNTCMNFPQVVH